MRSFWRLVLRLLCLAPAPLQAHEALPSWNDGHATRAIVAFGAKVTASGGPDFVKPEERVAVFDNDGTLWAEWPAYSQRLFALDRVKTLAPRHPDWRKKQPFKAALAGDAKTLSASGEKGAAQIIAATHAGDTPEAFQGIVAQWLETSEHPKSKSH